MRVTVLGGGLWGLSTAWALTRHGAMNVTVVDQGPIPNPSASSFDQHRLIRYPYDTKRGYCQLVDDAYMAWDNLWRDLRIAHYVETGSLCLSGDGHDWTGRSRQTLDRLGKAYDIWTPSEIARVCPFLNVDRIRYGLYMSRGGVLMADRIVSGLAAYLKRRGVSVQPNRKVIGLDPDRASVDLADGRRLDADALVICAGAWAGKLIPQVRERLVPKRQCVIYLKPPAKFAADWQRAPSLVDTGTVDGYAIPPVLGSGLKMGWLPHARPSDPDRPWEVNEGEAEGMLAELSPVLRDADAYQITDAKICFYGMAPDSRFMVEPVGTSERCWVMTGGSGHGFKFGPLLGQAIARRLAGIDFQNAEDLTRWSAGMDDGE